jgi:hypothetical protein
MHFCWIYSIDWNCWLEGMYLLILAESDKQISKSLHQFILSPAGVKLLYLHYIISSTFTWYHQGQPLIFSHSLMGIPIELLFTGLVAIFFIFLCEMHLCHILLSCFTHGHEQAGMTDSTCSRYTQSFKFNPSLNKLGLK